MATTRKPAAKKTTAAAKKRTTRRTVPKPVPATPLTEEQRQGMMEAYWALKSNGLEIPEELSEVETWIAEVNTQRQAEAEVIEEIQAQREREVSEANKNGPWYVRNGYPAPFNLRLDRQTESRRIELKARGAAGDLHPLRDEDLQDPVLKQNLTLGLIEIIPAGEAALIIEKQTTNLGSRVHTPLALLRNELGQTYDQGAVKVEAEFNSQGVTVAQVDPRVMTGQLHDREIGGTRASGGLTRVSPGQALPQHPTNEPGQATSVVHSGFVPTGGNSVSIGLSDNARAMIVDDIARRKNTQGPSAGLGDVTVTVEPVQRT